MSSSTWNVFSFVIIELQVAGKIASCNVAFTDEILFSLLPIFKQIYRLQDFSDLGKKINFLGLSDAGKKNAWQKLMSFDKLYEVTLMHGSIPPVTIPPPRA